MTLYYHDPILSWPYTNMTLYYHDPILSWPPHMTMHVAETDILPCHGQVWRVGEGFRLWQETCCDDFVLMITDISFAVFIFKIDIKSAFGTAALL